MKLVISNNDEFVDDIRDAYAIYLIISQLLKNIEHLCARLSLIKPTIRVSPFPEVVLVFRIESYTDGVVTTKYLC